MATPSLVTRGFSVGSISNVVMGGFGPYNGLNVNLIRFGSKPALDVKYYNGTSLVDVELKINNKVIWSK